MNLALPFDKLTFRVSCGQGADPVAELAEGAEAKQARAR